MGRGGGIRWKKGHREVGNEGRERVISASIAIIASDISNDDLSDPLKALVRAKVM
jgi:hypothetical protein